MLNSCELERKVILFIQHFMTILDVFEAISFIAVMKL